jgi:hypothetical protein
MDQISIWQYNANIDQTLHELGTYVEPSTATELLKFLVEEQDRLGTGPEQLENTARRIRECRKTVARLSSVIDGLMGHGLIDQERLARALSVLSNMREAQRLVEERYEAMSPGSNGGGRD